MSFLYTAVAPDGTYKTPDRAAFKTLLESLSRHFPDTDIVVRCDELNIDTTTVRESEARHA